MLIIPKHPSWNRIAVILFTFGLCGCSTPPLSQTSLPSPTTVPGVTQSSIEQEQMAGITSAPETIANQVWQYLSEQREKLGLCPDSMDATTSQTHSEVYQVSEGKYLVQLLCFMAAYQGNYQYVLYESSANGIQVTPLNLSLFQSDDSGKLIQQETQFIGGLPTFDPDTEILTIFTKSRGLGDCGSYAQYQWKENQFELLQYRAKLECDGQYVAPEAYPQLYPQQ